MEKLKGLIRTPSKPHAESKKLSRAKHPSQSKSGSKSGLSKNEALEEIKRVQKEILALQTVKEFVKSSYETGMTKYWDIENNIVLMQEKVSKLQDEFDVEVVIEDNEARALMAEAALKSCQETLSTLEEKQEKCSKEVSEELKKIESARELLDTIKHQYLKDQPDEKNDGSKKTGNVSKFLDTDRIPLFQESKENDEPLDLSSIDCLTESELAEKVDVLVNKVVGLETPVSSQTGLINTLRKEAGSLYMQIKNLENEKDTLGSNSSKLRALVKELEEKLKRIEDINANLEIQKSNFRTDFTRARSNLVHLSEKLGNVLPDDDFPDVLDDAKPYRDENKNQKDIESISDTKKKDKMKNTEEDADVSKPPVRKEEVREPVKRLVSVLKKANEHEGDEGVGIEMIDEMDKDDLNWEQIFLSGSDAEKALLQEYTMVLKNYKDVKKKLRESETKERESQFESTVQIKELKESVAKKDQEIQALFQKLSLLQDDGKGKEDSGESPESEKFFDSNKNEEDKELDDEATGSSAVEEKFREEFDVMLDENLDFWLRFGTSFNQVQKFKSEVQDLKDEISKLRQKKAAEGFLTPQLKSEARPHYKHLREIETELALWLEQNTALKDDLKNRYNSLGSLQEEITRVLKEGTMEGEVVEFSSHQAAKLQGEIQNMKQENSKVRREIQAEIDETSLLQVEIEKTLRVLSGEFGITSNQPQLQQSLSKARVPLRSFIFGTRPKKNKQSFLSFMQAQANRKFPVVRAGLPMAITNR
ncbi:kinase-interacting protein 1-like isoform X2 [Andrographis paniculata]|nr:kinase-interacting protein 1-like isoform X2 [Andrographis paniculata]